MLTPKLFSGPAPSCPGLHDARPGAGDDHETGLHNFAPEIDGLLIFPFVRLRPRRAENRDLADARIRREEPERVAQFAQRGLDDAHVAGVLHVGQQLERVFDDVGDFAFVVAAALVSNEFLNPPLQFRVGGRFIAGPSVHTTRIARKGFIMQQFYLKLDPALNRNGG